jgi:hypothetical protein
MGPCRPDVHEWLEVEYTPAGDTDSPNIMAAISQLLANNQGNPPGSQEIPGDTMEERLRLLAETCMALEVNPQQFADLHQGRDGRQEQPGENQQQHPQQLHPIPVGQQAAVGGGLQVTGGQLPVQGEITEQVQQDGSSAVLLNILHQQQANHMEMVDRQGAQQDKLLTLLENLHKQNPVQGSTNGTPSTSSSMSTGRVGVMAPHNAENLALTGVSLPPMLHIEGDLTTIDMSKMKVKLKSGRNWMGESVTSVMEPWPQQYLDRLLTTPITHDKMSFSQHFCGSVTKIFSEMDPSLRGSRVENQIKLLMFLSKQSLLSPWEDILAMSDSFYSTVEQSTVSWDSWPSIQM